MAKTYRLTLIEVDDTGRSKKVIYDDVDAGYFISNVMKSLAKRVYEPAPVVRIEGQEEMALE